MSLDERLKAAAEAVREMYPDPTSPIARLDVPAEVATHLHQLLDHPPLGHVEEPQPSQWYELVFDDLATAYNARRNAGGQS